MDNRLREQFFSSMMCFKKLESAFSLECEMQMNEMAILKDILGGCSLSGKSCTNLNVRKMQERLRISKPAVSYILNTLEKKNYIVRGIDADDRRKISISATPEGKEAARRSMAKCDEAWENLLQKFGEDNMRQLIDLLTTLNELSRTMGQDLKEEKQDQSED